jgi:hypothetical protein
MLPGKEHSWGCRLFGCSQAIHTSSYDEPSGANLEHQAYPNTDAFKIALLHRDKDVKSKESCTSQDKDHLNI